MRIWRRLEDAADTKRLLYVPSTGRYQRVLRNRAIFRLLDQGVSYGNIERECEKLGWYVSIEIIRHADRTRDQPLSG
jgi:hypothetical protein